MSENNTNIVSETPAATSPLVVSQQSNDKISKRKRRVKRKLNSVKENRSFTADAPQTIDEDKKIETVDKIETARSGVSKATPGAFTDVRNQKKEEDVVIDITNVPSEIKGKNGITEELLNNESIIESFKPIDEKKEETIAVHIPKSKKQNFFTKLKKIFKKKKKEENSEEENEEDNKEENEEDNEEENEDDNKENGENEDENDEDYDPEDLFFSALRSPFDGWDYEINKKEKDKLEKYKSLIEQLKTKLPKFHKILESNMSEQDKEECLWQVAVLNDAHFNDEYVEEMHKINKKLNYFAKMSPEELDKYKTLELKFKDLYDNEKPLKNRILDLPVNEDIKRIIFRHYLMHGTNNEKEAKWLDIVLSIPWGKYTQIEIPNPTLIMKEWEECVEGMNPAKEEFILTLTDYVTNPTINPKILTLKGVPGCGKTLFVQSIAKILKLPVQWIDLAGMNEVNFIKGFAKTWEGSKIGRLVEAIINLGSMNGIIVLEEIDKIESKTGHGSETLNALVPILDRTRNHEFYDNYLSDIPVPLNNIIFIGTCNEDKGFPKYLLDRLNIIECEKPDMPRKIKIAKEYLLPQALKERNLSSDQVVLNEDVLRYIIEKYTDEPGVRTLKERVQSIIQRVNYFATIKKTDSDNDNSNTTKLHTSTSLKMPKSFTLPYTVTCQDVDEFLKFQKPSKENLTYFL